MNIKYPVALDNNYGIWNSFQNHYWPALYLIDAKRKLRYQKFGEGDYVESEQQIQKMLKEASAQNLSTHIVDLHPDGFEAAANWEDVESPENFLGYKRSEGFASPGGIVADKHVVYSVPKQLKLNQWGISGEWLIGKESILLTKGRGKMAYRF